MKILVLGVLGTSLAHRGCSTDALFPASAFEGGIRTALFVTQLQLCFILQTINQHQQLRATRGGTCEEHHTFFFPPQDSKTEIHTRPPQTALSASPTIIFINFENRNDPKD